MAHIAKLAREAALLAGLVTSLVPQGAARRIDEPSPGDCPF